MLTILAIAVIVGLFLSPRLIGAIVGSVFGLAGYGAKQAVRSTSTAVSSVKEGFNRPDDLKNSVSGFASRLQAWAETPTALEQEEETA